MVRLYFEFPWYLMSLFSQLLGIAVAIAVISLLFLVIFGQVTVRRLRKNPATKDQLGIEFASGWDILNVAQALSLPQWLIKRIEKSPLSFLAANSELLYRHTNKFDRFLARLFYWTFYTGGVSMLCLAILNSVGLIE